MSRNRGGKSREKRAERSARWAVALLLGATLPMGGCASAGALLPQRAADPLPYDSPVTSRTLDTRDAWLRHYLILQDPDAALTYLRLDGDAWIADRLLRSLQAAVVTRSAGDFSSSNALLEEAETEIERRKVLSVSQTAGSYLVSDRLLSYLPAAGERAMIPYYRMMNYVALGEAQNAAVEARRISALLDAAPPRDLGGCRQAMMLNYASGLVFEAAGEINDALVSLRRAEATAEGCGQLGAISPPQLRYDISRVAITLGFEELVDSTSSSDLTAATRDSPGQGEALVLIEHGFVAHRAEGAIHIPIYEDELKELAERDGDVAGEVAARITARLLNNVSDRGTYGVSWDDHLEVQAQARQAIGGAHIVRLAWPELHGARDEHPQLRVLSSRDTVLAPVHADLSAIAAHVLDAGRAASLARLVTRAVTKVVASRAVKNEAERQGGEILGFVAATLSNVAANATERADTRAWTLLPGQVSLARLTLPAGQHELIIQSYDRPSGFWIDVDLGTIVVEPGKVAFVERRVWREAAEDVDYESEIPRHFRTLDIAVQVDEAATTSVANGAGEAVEPSRVGGTPVDAAPAPAVGFATPSATANGPRASDPVLTALPTAEPN